MYIEKDSDFHQRALKTVGYAIRTYLDYLSNTEKRNELFPFLIGVFIVAGGSASTIFYFIAGIYVIFLNPKIGFRQLSLQTIELYKKLPALWIFPLFVVSLFLFSVSKPNVEELLGTIASHFQLLIIGPMVVGILAVSQSKNCVRYFINGLRLGILIIFPIAILQIVGFSMRPEGFSGNSLVFAFVMSLAGTFCFLQDNEHSQSQKLLFFVPSICAFIMVIISFSRAPILVAFILFVITFLFLVNRNMNLKWLWSVILFSIFGITIGVASIASTDFGARYFDKRILEPITGLIDGKVIDNSIRKRADLNYSGAYAFFEQPLAGYGLQNTVRAANSVSDQALGHKTEYEFSHLHNEYLTYAVAGGVLLLFQYILVLSAPLLILMRRQRSGVSQFIQHFAILSSIGFAGISLTNVVLGHDIMSTFISVCIVLITISCVNRDSIIKFE